MVSSKEVGQKDEHEENLRKVSEAGSNGYFSTDELQGLTIPTVSRKQIRSALYYLADYYIKAAIEVKKRKVNKYTLVNSIGIEEDTNNLFLRTYKVPYRHADGVGLFQD